MKIEYLKKEDKEAEIMLNNLTIAEILRVYLNKDDNVDFAAWRREHPTKDPVLKIKTGKDRNVDKAVEMAANQIEQEADSFVKDFKKSVK